MSERTYLQTTLGRGNDVGYKLPLILEEGSVMSYFSDALWTPQIEVYGVAFVFNQTGGCHKRFGFVRAKLWMKAQHN